jgi:hypothetical protein
LNREKRPIKILKKLTGLVWFRFYKPENKKIKPEKTEPKLFEPVFVLKTEPDRTETGRFEPVSIFLKKI